ncbi:MAG: spore maturation protein [Nitrospiraceae bacterium]|nr:MAG: spore maturation protein [Nitrospiraceae bacterium]
MVLNYIWVGFFLSAFAIGIVRLVLFHDVEVFSNIIQATFDYAKTGFEISLGLTGVLTLWMGLMQIGEKGGVVRIFSKMVGPFFHRLFPELHKDHPAIGSIMMNISANMLGLDNAATPLGLKAMKEMQVTNSSKDTASDGMIMFLVLNTSGLTLIPVTIMVYRFQMGAADPSDIFIPILLATSFSTLAGFISVSIYQRINLLDRVIMSYLAGISLLIGTVIFLLSQMSREEISTVSNVAANLLLFSIITLFILLALIKKVNVYETFISGAKDGFHVAVKIIPYLIAILVAVGVFRASGAMDMIIGFIENIFILLHIDSDFTGALPTAFMKPLSGSGARGMMVDAMNSYGADSFVGRVASIVQGATDTTFYILAVYFGSVGIKKTRYAVTCGLIADFAGITASILLAYLFFH